MGLGMARGGVVESSVPPNEEDQIDDQVDDGLEEVDPADEYAQNEGYADAADKEATETAARGQGWRPLAEYRGQPGGWKTAKQFISDGENYLPFVKKENRDLKDQLSRMGTEMEGMRSIVATTQADMRKLLDFSRRANQAGYDRAVKELKGKQREAVAAGDTVTFDQIEGQLEEMAEARAEGEESPAPAATPAPVPKPRVDLDPAIQQFVDENPWFNKDKTLNAAMVAEHVRVIEESPGMATSAQLEKAKEVVMARFPEKFGLDAAPQPPAPRRPAAPMPPAPPVRGSGARRPDGDPIESIPDARERAEARQGYLSAKKSMPNLTKAEYMEIFNNPHADVLETINANKPRKQ